VFSQKPSVHIHTDVTPVFQLRGIGLRLSFHATRSSAAAVTSSLPHPKAKRGQRRQESDVPGSDASDERVTDPDVD
jgi:hypothetical protein